MYKGQHGIILLLQYDAVYLTCSKKLMCSQLSLPHGSATSKALYFNISLGNPLEWRGNYSATSNNMKLVHWPLMGGLLHLVQRGGDWAEPQPTQVPPRCTKCNGPSINGQ